MRMLKWRMVLKILISLTGSLLLLVYVLTFYTTDINNERHSSVPFLQGRFSQEGITHSHKQYTGSNKGRFNKIFSSTAWLNRVDIQPVISQGNILRGEKDTGASNAHGLTVIQSNEPCFQRSKHSTGSNALGRSSSNGRWFNYTMSKSYSFYAYTALYDDRASLLSEPVIRIIAVTYRHDELVLANISVPKLYCAFYFAEDDVIRYVSMEGEPRRIGGGWTLLGEPVKEYIYTCPLIKHPLVTPGQRNPLPRALMVVDQPGKLAVTACMPVEVPEKIPHRQDFIVCVQVAYGTLNPYSLVEWLEVQRILGVGHVSIYNLSMNGVYSDRVLENYISEGFVDVRHTSFIDPHGSDSKKQEFLLHGSPVINDCAYRNMYRFNYVIVIDFDELLMPRQHTTLQQLVTFLSEQPLPDNPQAFYVFYNQYYFVDMQQNIRESPYLTFLRHRRRVAVSPFGYAVKSIVNLQACIQLHNHWCWGVTPGFVASEHPDMVKSNISVIQHYKQCHFNKDECDLMMSDKNITQDEDVGGVWRFRHALRKNVAEKVKTILGHNL